MVAKSVGNYMDLAREANELTSDRALARLLGVSQVTISWWRTEKGFPRDEEMRRLARLSGSDEAEALLLLNYWRAADADTREAYRRVLRRLGSTTAAALIAASTLAGGGAGDRPDPRQLVLPQIVYYGK